MTPEQIERHRKRFEPLAIKTCYSLTRSMTSGKYISVESENQWQGYLMFAENLEVELSEAEHHSLYSADDDDFSIGIKCGLYTARKNLESQGIKVKPCK